MRLSLGVAAAVGLLAIGLAGCETARESAAASPDACIEAGYKPRTRAYNDCYRQTYSEARRDSRSQDNAVAAGVIAGVVGGAIVAADRPHYGYYGGYRRCWRCY